MLAAPQQVKKLKTLMLAGAADAAGLVPWARFSLFAGVASEAEVRSQSSPAVMPALMTAWVRLCFCSSPAEGCGGFFVRFCRGSCSSSRREFRC